MSITSPSFLNPSIPLRVIGAYLRGLRSVITSPTLFALFGLQVAIGICSYLTLAYLAFTYRSDMTAVVTGTVDTWWEYLLSWIVFAFLLVMNGFAAYLVTAILGGFVLEWLAQSLLRQFGAPLDEELSIRAVGRMVRRTAVFTVLRLLGGLVALAVSVLAFFFPPLGVVAMVLLAFLVGIDMLELPNSVLDARARAKINLMGAHKAEILWFGIISTAVLAVPFVGILLLPVICAAATHTLFDMYSG